MKRFFGLNPTQEGEGSKMLDHYYRDILSVLCIFASSPCTHRFFPRILRRFCVLHHSPKFAVISIYAWILSAYSRNTQKECRIRRKKFSLQLSTFQIIIVHFEKLYHFFFQMGWIKLKNILRYIVPLKGLSGQII